MKTNATINKVNYSLSKIILIAFFLLNVTISFAQSNSKAVIKVENDRVNRSVPLTGTYYKMEIINSGQSDTFDLSSININERSTNPDGSDVKDNVSLKVVFMNKDLKTITNIRANAGETVKFFAYIEVPKGTITDRWSTNQVIASSQSKSNYKVDTVLHTVVINSNDN